MYLTYYPDLALPGALEATRDFAELALKRGASELALLSGRGEREAERAEEAVRDTGAELTIPLDLVHAELQRGLLARARRERRARLGGEVSTPFLDVDDIADVAVAALTDDRHVGQLYELTGPRSLTFARVAAEIGAAVRRDVRYVPISLGSSPPKRPSRGSRAR